MRGALGHGYGPIECTTFAVAHRATEDDLYLAKDGLIIDYINRPELTRERFSVMHGVRTYRTSDWGRLRVDGVLEFLDRFDNQMKVRGFRVELGGAAKQGAEHWPLPCHTI